MYDKDMDVVWREEMDHSRVAISPDGRYLVVVTDGRVVFFDIDSDGNLQSCRVKSSVVSMDWSPDGKYIAMGRIRFSSSRNMLAASSRDGGLYLFDAKSGRVAWCGKHP